MLAYVTGAAGFIGSHLSERLLRDGWMVVGIDNLATGDARNLESARASARFRFVRADVARPWDAWTATLDAPDAIVHLASPASPLHYERLALETLAVNALGTMHASACAERAGATLVYASTSEAYGDPLEHPQAEAYWGNVNPVGPRACYDEAKRFGEAYVTTAVRKLGVDGRVARIFNTYGPRMQLDDGRVVPSFALAAACGRPLRVYGDGAQTRSFCYVDDLVDGLVRLATRPGLAGRVVNLGTPEEHTIRELAAIVADVAGVPLRVEHAPLPANDPTRRRPDVTLARELLGWAGATPLREGLRRVLDDVRARIAGDAVSVPASEPIA